MTGSPPISGLVKTTPALASFVPDTPHLQMLANGPLLIRLPVQVQMPDGSVVTAENGALCRCGHSASKPYCDGAHKALGFQG
ncbi:MAG: hypothetical protein QOD77_2025 [Thermoplasmata archaeon]|nr:hypothetical protein [Thermoplasmata archaeon]